MKYRKGLFFVVYKKKGKKIYYLLLKRILHWSGWEFPKGGIENKEENKETIKREIREETGLKVKKIINMKRKGKFDYGRELPDRQGFKGQTWKLYAVEVGSGRIRLDKREHTDYKWLEFRKAYDLLTWGSQKKCLKFVNEKLGD